MSTASTTCCALKTRLPLLSLWIAAAGDPDYRDAFLTILKDPMTGHRDLITSGRGVRKVTQLQAERAMSVGTGRLWLRRAN